MMNLIVLILHNSIKLSLQHPCSPLHDMVATLILRRLVKNGVLFDFVHIAQPYRPEDSLSTVKHVAPVKCITVLITNNRHTAACKVGLTV